MSDFFPKIFKSMCKRTIFFSKPPNQNNNNNNNNNIGWIIKKWSPKSLNGIQLHV